MYARTRCLQSVKRECPTGNVRLQPPPCWTRDSAGGWSRKLLYICVVYVTYLWGFYLSSLVITDAPKTGSICSVVNTCINRDHSQRNPGTIVVPNSGEILNRSVEVNEKMSK